jgi:hypothetical protein
MHRHLPWYHQTKTDTMKKIILIFLLSLMINCIALAQDTLTYRNKKHISVKIIEITPTEIKFKKTENLNGPTYTALKRQVLVINYENGITESFYTEATTDSIKEAKRDIIQKRLRYNGPRFGFTVMGPGTSRDWLKENHKAAIITQFGWQFETRLFTMQDGTSGLVEWVVLVGGAEQGMFLTSGSMLFGLRGGKRGLEFGIGPNLSFTGMGLAIAVGGSIRTEHACIPINLALIPSVYKEHGFSGVGQTGARFSLLIGFNTRTR